MEQTKKTIKLETAEYFKLPHDELKRMYLALALSQYSYDRHPNYDERQLLRQLDTDFSKHLSMLHQLCLALPENHRLIRIRAFFDLHHKQLQQILPSN